LSGGPPPKTKHLNPPPTSFLFNMIVSERGDFQCTKTLVASDHQTKLNDFKTDSVWNCLDAMDKKE